MKPSIPDDRHCRLSYISNLADPRRKSGIRDAPAWYDAVLITLLSSLWSQLLLNARSNRPNEHAMQLELAKHETRTHTLARFLDNDKRMTTMCPWVGKSILASSAKR